MNKLGIYFIVYQSQFNGFVKCFLDGDENYKFYTYEEFLDFTNELNNSSIRNDLEESLSESSFFLWNIEGNSIKRLSMKNADPESLFNQLKWFQENQKLRNAFDDHNPIQFKKGLISISNLNHMKF